VYILSSRSRNLYTGVTNNLRRRLSEHRSGIIPGFTSKYRTCRLVHFERFGDVRNAIIREKEIKSWRRDNKIALIEKANSTWLDLAEDWLPEKRMQIPRSARDDNEKAGSESGKNT
jgi:putative endonuclease